jgi:glycosyltransferase involved in cell wall biosynthesis
MLSSCDLHAAKALWGKTVKVTFLLPCYPLVPIGGFRAVYEYANHFAFRGHQVTVVHARRTRYTQAPTVSGPLDLARHAKKRLAEILKKPSINWQRIDERVRLLFVPDDAPRYLPAADAVFATSWQTVSCVLESPEEKGKKCYLIQHYETWEAPKDIVDATWRAPLYKAVIARWLVDVGRTLGCRDVTYIPYGMDRMRYRLSQAIEGRPHRISMLFAQTPFKASVDGIAALEIAKTQYPNLSAVLFGTPRRQPSIPDWIEYHQNPAQDFIVSEIYNKSSVFVCSSLSEGFFLPSAEAACCGCAVVSTDNGGAREYVEDRVTGLLSPPGNPAALAANICLLLTDEALRARLARACNTYVARFSWEESASRLDAFIANVLQCHETAEHSAQPV